MTGPTNATTRMKECVEDLDRAWSFEHEAYAGGVEQERFSVAVRYVHIFLRTTPGIVAFQAEVPVREVREAIATLDATWKPDDASLPQGEQTGRYDDALDDKAVRIAHLTMKGILSVVHARMAGG